MMEQIMAELLQYGMSGIFIAYLIYDREKREKLANERSRLEDERNEKYLLSLEKISNHLDKLSDGQSRLSTNNEKMIDKVDNFINGIK